MYVGGGDSARADEEEGSQEEDLKEWSGTCSFRPHTYTTFIQSYPHKIHTLQDFQLKKN